MPSWILPSLFLFMGLFGGGSCLLLGWGIIPRQPRHPQLHAAWLARSGHLLRWLGAILLLLGLQMPLLMGCGPALPPWVGQLMLAVVCGIFLAFVLRTWEPEPPVLWPKGFGAWFGFCFSVFASSAVLAGMLGSVGIDVGTDDWYFWGLAIPAFIVVRGLQVWGTRLMARHGRPMGT
jgi:hypothetical protein